MSGRNSVLGGRLLAIVALAAVAGGPAYAAGFGIFEQGSKAMGMAGAFTAQADDPSLLFHNAGGLAFVEEGELMAGFTWIKGAEAEFQGANPFPGEGYRAEQELLSEFPPHLYYVAPINDTWKWGVGVTAPFGLVTEWENPNQFAGRFVSTRAALQTVDVNPTLGWQVTPTFGLGFGGVARFSTVELDRNVPAINPFTQRAIDVGRLALESDMDSGFGFNVGVLHRPSSRFSWGLSYRSKIEVEYGGDARIAQVSSGNQQLDALIAAQIPFNRDLPVETAIEFPDMASFGVALGLTDRLLIEADVNWTGWSTFDAVPITFVDPFTGGTGSGLPDQEIPEHWDDAMNYRVGLRWGGDAGQWRLGYVFDESPQPEESVSPLLPDADRHGITVGFGRDAGRLPWDLAFMYLKFDERERDISFRPPVVPVEEGPFFGTYNTTAYLLGVTIGWQ
jgi:long-chain fatty acid transport protein